MSNAIGSTRESNPSRRICNLRAVPLDHVGDNNFIVQVRQRSGSRHCYRCDRSWVRFQGRSYQTQSPTARYRCVVSSELCCPGAKPRRSLRRSTAVKARFDFFFDSFTARGCNTKTKDQSLHRSNFALLHGTPFTAAAVALFQYLSCLGVKLRRSTRLNSGMASIKKIKSSLYSRYYAETRNERRGPSP